MGHHTMVSRAVGKNPVPGLVYQSRRVGVRQITRYGIAAFTEQRQHKELGSTQSNDDDRIVELPLPAPFPPPSFSVHTFPPLPPKIHKPMIPTTSPSHPAGLLFKLD